MYDDDEDIDDSDGELSADTHEEIDDDTQRFLYGCDGDDCDNGCGTDHGAEETDPRASLARQNDRYRKATER